MVLEIVCLTPLLVLEDCYSLNYSLIKNFSAMFMFVLLERGCPAAALSSETIEKELGKKEGAM